MNRHKKFKQKLEAAFIRKAKKPFANTRLYLVTYGNCDGITAVKVVAVHKTDDAEYWKKDLKGRAEEDPYGETLNSFEPLKICNADLLAWNEKEFTEMWNDIAAAGIPIWHYK